MSEPSDIHRLLATSPEEGAATPLVLSAEEINLKLTQLKRYLKAGNLKAIDMAPRAKGLRCTKLSGVFNKHNFQNSISDWYQ